MSTFAHALTHRLNLCDVTVKTSSGNVTMLNEGAVVVNKTSGAATTVTLPVAGGLISGIAPVVWVIDGKGDAATNNVTVNTSDSKTVNGGSSYVVSENYGAVCLIYNGTEWNVLSAANPLSSTELGFLNGVTAGTVLASKAVVVDASKDVAGFRFVKPDTTNAVTAFSGGGQGSATALVTDLNRVTTCAAAGDSVKLPTSAAGMRVVVTNDGATDADVYPASGDAINAQSANVALRLKPGQTAVFYCDVAGTWSVQTIPARYASVAASDVVTAVASSNAFVSFANAFSIPANTLKAGSVVKVRALVSVADATGTVTLTCNIRVGGTSVVASTAVDPGATTDHHVLEAEFVARAAPGGTASCVAFGRWLTNTGGTIAHGSGYVAPANFATNGALTVDVQAKWSASNASTSARLEALNVEIN